MKKDEKKVENPFGIKFWAAWELWKTYKQEAYKFKYKTALSEQMAINEVVGYANGNEEVAIQIIKKSISSQWKGLHPLNNGQQPTSNTSARESLNNAINKRFGNG